MISTNFINTGSEDNLYHSVKISKIKSKKPYQIIITPVKKVSMRYIWNIFHNIHVVKSCFSNIHKFRYLCNIKQSMYSSLRYEPSRLFPPVKIHPKVSINRIESIELVRNNTTARNSLP